MHQQDIIAAILQHEQALRDLGVRSLTLFGSVVRGDQHADSDLDMLYEFEEGAATLEHFLAVQALLEEVVGRPVDLVSQKYLSPILARTIGDDVTTVLVPRTQAVLPTQ